MPSPVSALNKIKNMFSPLERTIIAHKLESMPSSQWAAYIKANAPKAAKKEALAIKLDELLARQPKLSKADIVKHIQENSPKINTKNLRADGYGIDETQYGKYVLPGGEDYTETLIHLPANTSSPSIRMQKVFEIADENGQLLASGTVPMSPRTLEKLNNNPNWVVREYEQPHPADILRDPSNFRSGHFDEPNVLAHLRTNIKLTPDNKDVLFLEELQSDWAQQGRKKGFLTPDLHVERRAQIKAEMDALAKEATAMRERGESPVDIRQRMRQLDDALRDIPTPKGVPSGPYVEDTGDWTALGLKKAIERAVDEGQSHLAWTTGAQQADRYNLAKQIDSINHSMNPDGTYSFSAIKGGKEVLSKEGLTQDELAEHLGKDIAEKIVKSEGADAPAGTNVGWEAQPSIYGDVDAPPQPRTLSGLDLQVGGEGMKTYYDQIIPSTANDILKSMGVTERVKPIGVQLGNNVSEQMGFEITPEIRDYVMNQGLPAFGKGGPVHMDEGGLNVRASGDYGNFDREGASGSHYNFSTDVDILNKYGFGVTKDGEIIKLPAQTYTYDDGYTETVPARKIKRDDISELRARYMTDDGVQYGVGRQPLAKGWSAYRTDPRTQATVGFNVSPQYKNLSVYRSDPRSQSSVGVNVSPYYKGVNYTKNFAEGGKVSDPFANLSMLDKAKLLAKAAKYRIQYNKQAVEHGKYPDALSSELKKNYLDTVGNSRVNRSPLDVALNYGGGYDFGVRQDVPADVARDMGKAYQYTDYFFSPFTGPKSDAVGDYYENMAGVEAGIKERGRRATEAEIQRRSAEYGKRSSKMLPQYEEPDYAEGGEVETDDFDYDEMYEFKKDEPAFAEGGEVDYDAMYEFR